MPVFCSSCGLWGVGKVGVKSFFLGQLLQCGPRSSQPLVFFYHSLARPMWRRRWRRGALIPVGRVCKRLPAGTLCTASTAVAGGAGRCGAGPAVRLPHAELGCRALVMLIDASFPIPPGTTQRSSHPFALHRRIPIRPPPPLLLN